MKKLLIAVALPLAVIAPLVVIIVMMSSTLTRKDCLPGGTTTPDTGGDIVDVGELPGSPSAPIRGQISVATANIPPRSGASGFRSSMPRVVSARPDVVALQEQFSRSARQIAAAAPGYGAWKDPRARGQAASTAVMWRKSRWRKVDAGRVRLVSAGPQKWDAGRSATWVTLRDRDGAVVSMVSVHHMVNPGKFGPNRSRRQAIYRDAMATLTRLGDQLGARGPVFVAGDMNTHANQRAGWTASSTMREAGYGLVDHSVDHIYYNRRAGISPAQSWHGPMASDHDWVAAHFNMSGAAATSSTGGGRGTPATTDAGTARPAATTPTAVAGLTSEQTRNAATIIAAGQQADVPARGIVTALAAALQESGLRNLSGGDRDSLGLFQQRPSAGWGTPDQITTPQLAAQAFFGTAEHTGNGGLLDLAGWETMSVTQAAQAVQASAFPDAYADDEDLARRILAALDKTAGLQLVSATSQPHCTGTRAVAAGTCPRTDSPAENGLTPDGLLVLRCVDAAFGSHVYGGVADRPTNPGSDHPTGRAVDVMIDDWSSADGIAKGDAIADWLRAHHQELGIRYVIWRDRIWNAGDSGWSPYGHPSGATDATSRHLDHVHVSVHGTSGTGLGGGDRTTPLPAGSFVDQANWGGTGAHWESTHTGNDYSAPCGTPVFASTGGRVAIDTGTGWAGPWLVKIAASGTETWYAHMQAVNVSAGDTVKAGQLIGRVGTEGNSTGCHLHFEVHTGGRNINPVGWLRTATGTATT